jgi:phosphatidylcholine synthase
LCLFTCIDVKVPHPVRVRHMRGLTLPVLAIWLAAMLYLTIAWPKSPAWGRAIELAGVVYFVCLSVRRTLRGPDAPAVQRS